MFKLKIDTSKSHRTLLVVAWLFATALLVDFINSGNTADIQLPILIASASAIGFMVTSIFIKNEELSEFTSFAGGFLIIVAAGYYSIDITGENAPILWWFVVVFAASATSLIYGLTSGAILVSLTAIMFTSEATFASGYMATLLGTLAAIIGGSLLSSSNTAPRQAVMSLSDRLKPELLLASIADGIIVVDNERLIRVFNQAAQDITGWTDNVEELDYRSVISLINVDGSTVSDRENPFEAVLEGSNTVKDNNGMLATKSKKTINLSLIVSPIKNHENKTIAAVGIFGDITQEKNEEKQRAEFISTASHEMRTPVAAIEGYLALATNDKVAKIDSKARDYLEKAHSSTQHLGKLFQDLLTAAKSEDGRLANHPIVVEVGQFIDEVVEAAKFAAEKKGLLLKDDTKSDGSTSLEKIRPLSYIHVDPDRLREVLTNLVDNAIKYTEEGNVTLGLHTEEKEIIISIQDTGQGIPQEDIQHLFQKFYRVDNSATRQIGGTGLGLFISRKIVELYNGRVWAESNLGQGSTFFVAIPRINAEEAQRLQQQESATVPVAKANSTRTIIDAPVEKESQVSSAPNQTILPEEQPEPEVGNVDESKKDDDKAAKSEDLTGQKEETAIDTNENNPKAKTGSN